MMKSLRSTLAAVAACGLLFSAAAVYAAPPTDYQITGNVSDLTDTTIKLITNKKETWGFARDTTTKAPDGLKIGDKVTVHYTMVAGNVEMKPDTGAKDKEKDKKASPAPSKAAEKKAAAASPTP